MNKVTGTLIWYYHVCRREVWLMAREINPNEDDYFLEMGRLIHEDVYPREKKEIETTNMKIDLMKNKNGEMVVGEVKKSSRFLLPSEMQLAFYLYQLKKKGLNLTGELLIPKEKKRIPVKLTDDLEGKVKQTLGEIKEIIDKVTPPEAERVQWCRHCAYSEFCWAEV